MIVDAVSAFGALPLDLSAQPEIDAAVFTSNKCLEGVPGMAFAVARIDRVEACAGNAGSWSLDLSSIYAHALRSGWGSFRFTPPAQVLNAFNVALDFYDAEGGQPARLARYTANMRTLYDGVRGLGLTPCLPAGRAGSDHRQRACAGRSGLGPAALRRCAEGARRADQQFLQHRTAELPRGLHRRDHAGGHGEGRRRDGRGIGRAWHRAAQGGLMAA